MAQRRSSGTSNPRYSRRHSAMSKAIGKSLGKRLGAGWRQRQREGIAARQAKGLPFGGTNKGPTLMSVCANPTCGRTFTWRPKRKVGKPYWEPKFCSWTCSSRDLESKCRKLPDSETLRRLYVDEGLTCSAIARLYGISGHSPVKDALKKAGIPRRKRGTVSAEICIEPDCNKVVYKTLNKSNGSWNGRRCFEHQKKFKKESNAKAFRKWWERKKRLHAAIPNHR